MKKLTFLATLFALNSISVGAVEIEELEGDKKLACEAVLCLSSSSRPSECNPSINHYFSIHRKKWRDTVKARKNFLELCPRDNNGVDTDLLSQMGINQDEQNAQFDHLTNVISSIPHDCQVETLNKQVEQRCSSYNDNGICDKWEYRIKPTLPQSCKNLLNHEWTANQVPVYIGDYSWSENYPIKDVWIISQ